MKIIGDLLQHGEPVIRDLGQRAVRYKAQRAHNEITQEEFESLCAQLLDLEALNAACTKEEERQQIALAVEFLKTYLTMLV